MYSDLCLKIFDWASMIQDPENNWTPMLQPMLDSMILTKEELSSELVHVEDRPNVAGQGGDGDDERVQEYGRVDGWCLESKQG